MFLFTVSLILKLLLVIFVTCYQNYYRSNYTNSINNKLYIPNFSNPFFSYIHTKNRKYKLICPKIYERNSILKILEYYHPPLIIQKNTIKNKQQSMHHTVPHEHLSIIITTSPIRSQPDTQVIDDSINSILAQKSLDNIHIYIICDGAKITEQNKYKSGIITQDRMDNYVEYKKRLHLKYNNKQKYTIIQREYRHGFAENIKYVMEEYAKTDHVMIYQHDHVIEKQIDFYAVMEMMRKYKDNINYVTFMHKSYRTIIPRIISVVEVKKFIVKLIGKQEGYNVCLQMKDFENDIVQYFRGKFGLPLVPLNFWYDKVHIASRRFYLDVIFNEEGHFDPNRGKNMKTISFPEDTFGHCMKYCINEKPEKLLEYGAYILWDEQPVFYHQSGRAFMGEEQRKDVVASNKSKMQEAESSSSSDQNVDDIDLQGLLLEDTK